MALFYYFALLTKHVLENEKSEAGDGIRIYYSQVDTNTAAVETLFQQKKYPCAWFRILHVGIRTNIYSVLFSD